VVAAEIARATGLNGQTVVVGAENDRATIEAAAAEVGALIEFEPQGAASLSLRGQGFDVVVSAQALAGASEADRTAHIASCFAALRPGGRIIVIDGGATAGRLWSSPAPALDSPVVLRLLEQGGGRAARSLGTIDHLRYYEARKNR
jgi:2-polyprenyl-3-methyl-5-hydroxy-6-metoxy-1,4-benzoquinol methylase